MQLLSLIKILLVLALLTPAFPQCLNDRKLAVDWFVKIIIPDSVAEGYLYFDSTFNESAFQRKLEQPDAEGTPLTLTLNQINQRTLNFIAWNDQNPNGSTSSSKAHSKAVLAYENSTLKGFAFIHSMPGYPQFLQLKVNVKISPSQSIYGQHVLCVSTNSELTGEMLRKTSIISPSIYISNLNKDFNISSTNLFQYSYPSIGLTPSRFIYKNGKLNGSIFEEGVSVMLGSNLIAETWGRPIQGSWCGNASYPLKVYNCNIVKFNAEIEWKQTQDHSKWIYAIDNDSSCFGDMNRMSSQHKRGGAFYCLNHPLLHDAMKKLITTPSSC